jgi:hypothetical protein
MTEELWGGHVPDPWARGHDLFRSASHIVQHPRTALFRAQEAIKHTLDFMDNPRRALQDRDNEIAQKLWEKFGGRVTRLTQPRVSRRDREAVLAEIDILQPPVPDEIRQAFFDVITEGTRAVEGARTGYSIYRIIRELREFNANPWAWILNYLDTQLQQLVIDAIKFYAKERIYDWIGADRIGCHSLLAKDSGLEPFFKQQKQCATAVHWYIVKTLLRPRDDPDPDKRFIDWLELLEYFLRNPLPRDANFSREARVYPVTIVHTVGRDEDLQSLTTHYRSRAIRPREFDAMRIIDANFAMNSAITAISNLGVPPRDAARHTGGAIDHILYDPAWSGGISIEPRRPIFRNGLKILIPDQGGRMVFKKHTGDQTLWFKEILEKMEVLGDEDAWKVFKGYEDPESGTSVPPLQHHRPRYFREDEQDEFKRRIQKGKQLRQNSREAYRPGESRRSTFYCH